MGRAYGRARVLCFPAERSCRAPLSSGELLLAVDALHQRRVPVRLDANGITVAKDEYVGILAGLATSRDIGDVHNRIAFGDKPVELHRQ
jgi:hypothetical protein